MAEQSIQAGATTTAPELASKELELPCLSLTASSESLLKSEGKIDKGKEVLTPEEEQSRKERRGKLVDRLKAIEEASTKKIEELGSEQSGSREQRQEHKRNLDIAKLRKEGAYIARCIVERGGTGLEVEQTVKMKLEEYDRAIKKLQK